MGILLRRMGTGIKNPVSLRKFHERHNTILIVREVGGVGDVLMHRMLFEDMKRMMPDCKIHFACPQTYKDLVDDHPYIDKVLDCRTVSYDDYTISYNTSVACGKYEMSIAPNSGLHRSDIWAEHCGFQLDHHEMHIRLDAQSITFGERILHEVKKDHTQPAVLIAPISAMAPKDLNDEQLAGLVDGLRMRGCVPYAVHHKPIPILSQMNVRVLNSLTMKKWMGVVHSADYVVSVDTGCFHMAGGLKKPVVGIFTFADGLVYGKYYPKFELVQKHRKNGDWPCGPCYTVANCPKTRSEVKPCLTQITTGMILDGVDRLFDRFPWDRSRSTSLGVIR